MRYKALLIDADDTIFDFRAAEAYAIGRVLDFAGIDDPDAREVYHDINAGHWRALERGETTHARLRIERFEDLARRYSCACDAAQMADMFVTALSSCHELIPGALEAVAAISAHMPVAIVTNGIPQVQHARFDPSPIMKYISALVISGEEGYDKPDPRLLYAALRRLGAVAPRDALMIGDGITSDMAAANAAGMDAYWFNPRRKPRPELARFTGEIYDFDQAVKVALTI